MGLKADIQLEVISANIFGLTDASNVELHIGVVKRRNFSNETTPYLVIYFPVIFLQVMYPVEVRNFQSGDKLKQEQ